jgi:integrase
MPLYLWQRKDDRSSNYYVRGTYVVWRNGRRRSKQFQPKSTGTGDREEAEAILRQLADKVQRGNVENRDAPPIFSDLVNSYLDAGKSDRYLEPIINGIGDLELHDLTQAKVDSEGRKAYPGVAPPTLRRQWHGVINAILSHAGEPIRFKLPAKSKSTVRYCTPKEAEAICQAVADGRYADVWKTALVELLFGTGCRAGEAMKLDGKRDVNLDYGTVTFRDTKNRTQRTVRLVARTLKALEAVPNVKHGGPLIRRSLNRFYAEKVEVSGHQLRFLRAAAEEAGVEFNPHMTRHSFATWFYEQTKDTLRLRQICGWKSVQLVDVYTHLGTAEVGRDAIKLGWDFRPFVTGQVELVDSEAKRA